MLVERERDGWTAPHLDLVINMSYVSLGSIHHLLSCLFPVGDL